MHALEVENTKHSKPRHTTTDHSEHHLYYGCPSAGDATLNS